MFIYGWIFFIYIYIWPVWDSDKQLPDISVLAAKLSSCWQQTYFAAGMGPSLVKIIPASQSVKKKKKKNQKSEILAGCTGDAFNLRRYVSQSMLSQSCQP